MTLGDRIKLARESKGWGQKELAVAVGVEDATVSRWEGNVHAPKPKHWPEIIKALGHPREWFNPENLDDLQKKISEIEENVRNLSVAKPESVDQDELSLLSIFRKTAGNDRLRKAILRQVAEMAGDDSESGALEK